MTKNEFIQLAALKLQCASLEINPKITLETIIKDAKKLADRLEDESVYFDE